MIPRPTSSRVAVAASRVVSAPLRRLSHRWVVVPMRWATVAAAAAAAVAIAAAVAMAAAVATAAAAIARLVVAPALVSSLRLRGGVLDICERYADAHPIERRAVEMLDGSDGQAARAHLHHSVALG